MRVVIAEDLVLLRDGIARAIAAHGFEVVAEVGDAGRLVDVVAREHPDLVITDVRMPPGFSDEGARAARLLRDRFPRIGVVVLSHVVEPELALVLAAERPSGFGYLLKDRVMDVGAFIATLRTVGAGGTVIDPLVVERGLARRDAPLRVLTEREREVLGALARGLSNAAIAHELFVSERTVDAHLRSIFGKLGLEPTSDANRRVRAALLWLSEE